MVDLDRDRNGFAWGGGHFLGEWSIEDMVAFVTRVHEIAIEERERAEGGHVE